MFLPCFAVYDDFVITSRTSFEVLEKGINHFLERSWCVFRAKGHCFILVKFIWGYKSGNIFCSFCSWNLPVTLQQVKFTDKLGISYFVNTVFNPRNGVGVSFRDGIQFSSFSSTVLFWYKNTW